MTADREKLIDRIRKLQAKGSDKGVTKDEANAFLDAAARLMAQHGVTDDDIETVGMDADVIWKRGVHNSMHKAHPACITLSAIGKLTGTCIGTIVSTKRFKDGGREELGGLKIAGRPADREIASYMFDQVRNLIDGAWKAERKHRIDRALRALAERHGLPMAKVLIKRRSVQEAMTEGGVGIGHKQRRSFGYGMALRMSKRIEAMAVRHADSERALVIWNADKAEPYEPKKRKPDMDWSAFARGDKAGENASLGQGVATHDSKPLAIGRD